MTEIHQLKPKQVTNRPVPERIRRHCDYGLVRAVKDVEAQLGTVGAYNRLCDLARTLKAQIDSGNAKQPLSEFVADPDYIYPVKPLPKKP